MRQKYRKSKEIAPLRPIGSVRSELSPQIFLQRVDFVAKTGQ